MIKLYQSVLLILIIKKTLNINCKNLKSQPVSTIQVAERRPHDLILRDLLHDLILTGTQHLRDTGLLLLFMFIFFEHTENHPDLVFSLSEE